MITINDASKEQDFQDYIDRKNEVKGAIKSVSNQLANLQAKQLEFVAFLADKPEYALHYSESVDAIPELANKFSQLSDLANSWIETVNEIKQINPLF